MDINTIAAAAAAAAGQPADEAPSTAVRASAAPPQSDVYTSTLPQQQQQQQQQQTDQPQQDTGGVATLFVSGLPPDMRQRELHTLFRPYKGYEGSTMKYMGEHSKVVAFVSFSGQEQALKAKDELQGLQYDPENPHTVLRIELAKSNTRSKRPHDPAAEAEKKMPRYETEGPSYPGYPAPASMGYPQVGYESQPQYGAQYPMMPGMAPMPGMPPMPAMPSAPAPAPAPAAPRSSSGPCNTIFVSGLVPQTTEEHLRTLYSNCGQKRVRLFSKGNNLSAFIEFETVEQAQYAISSTNGYNFLGSNLRVEFARSPMKSRGPPGPAPYM